MDRAHQTGYVVSLSYCAHTGKVGTSRLSSNNRGQRIVRQLPTGEHLRWDKGARTCRLLFDEDMIGLSWHEIMRLSRERTRRLYIASLGVTDTSCFNLSTRVASQLIEAS